MKIKIKKNIVYNYYAIFIIAFYCLGMDQFLSYPLGSQPKIFWAIIFAFTGLLYFAKTKIIEFLGNPFIRWLLAYFLISLGTILYSNNFKDGITYVAYTLIISIPLVVIVLNSSEIDKLYFISKFPLLLLLASASILIDASYPINQIIDVGNDAQSGRSSGFYFNPNSASMAISMLFLPALYASKSALKQVLLVFVSLAAILATVSRGGIVVFIFLFMFAVIFKVINKKALVLILFGFMAIIIASSIFIYSFSEIFNIQSQDNISRLGFLFGQSDISVMNDDYRWHLVLESLNRAKENPILGCGVGCSFVYDASFMHSPHSMFLRYFMEFGIVGLILWGIFIWISSNVSYGLKYGLGIAIAVAINSLFSHNLTEQSFILAPLIIFSLCIPAIKKDRENIQ